MRFIGITVAALLASTSFAMASCPATLSDCPSIPTHNVMLGGAIINGSGVPLTPPAALPSAAGQVLTTTDTSGHTAWSTVGAGTVTTMSVAPANGLTGSVANANSTPALTLGTTVSGMVKGSGGGFSAAIVGTDYLAPNSSGAALTGLIWSQLGSTPSTLAGYGITNGLTPNGNGSGLTGLTYTQLPTLGANQLLGGLSATTPSGISVPSCSGAANALTWTLGTGFGCNTISGGAGGTVTSTAVTPANGFTGTVANSTTTPTITLGTTVTGLLKGNGTAVSTATAGTDYVAPGGALGTPSSATLTNATGLPVAGVIGLGTMATQPASGVAISGGSISGAAVAATSVVSGSPTGGNLGAGTVNATGVFVNGVAVGGGLSVPSAPLLSGNGSTLGSVTAINSIPIGGTTPAAGAFTNLNGTGSTSIFGFPSATATLGSGGITRLTDGTGAGTASFQFKGAVEFAGDDILQLTSNIAGGNTFAIQNLNPAGYSALVLRDNFGNDVGALHSDNNYGAIVTGSISGTTFTVSSLNTGGSISIGATVVGIGVPAGTYVQANLGGNGQAGTYTLNQSATVSSETMDLMVGGMSFESDSLFSTANPAAQPAKVNFRQTYQPGGTLAFVNFLDVDTNSNMHFAELAACGASGNNMDTFGIYRVGFAGVCTGAGQPATGVAFGVNWGGSYFSRTNAGGNVAANADVTISNATAPDLKFNVPFGSGWTADILLNVTGTTHRLDFVDTQGSGVVPFSIALDASKGVTMGGPTRYTGAVSSAPTTGATVTFATTQRLAIIAPAGTLAALTVQLPACASTNDGDERSFLTTQALTALTISTAAGSIGNGTATTAAAGSGHAYHCLGSATTWYQMY